MITSRSRYANSSVEKIAVGSDIRQTITSPPSKAFTTQFTYHIWRADDRPDLMAQQYYNDGTMWWAIARANPEILDWQALFPGTVIRIPGG